MRRVLWEVAAGLYAQHFVSTAYTKAWNLDARIVAVASELEEDGVELAFSNLRRSSLILFAVNSPIELR